MISVVIPTRSRLGHFRQVIKSLAQGNDYPIEFLVWLDSDDPDLNLYWKWLRRITTRFGTDIKVWVKPRVTYEYMHVMWNFLMMQAQYNWVLFWNDDARMVRPDWYEALTTHLKENGRNPRAYPVIINLSEIKENRFPIVSRKYLDLVGHYSMNPISDIWIRMVCDSVPEILHRVDFIPIKHRRLRDGVYQEMLRQRNRYKNRDWDILDPNTLRWIERDARVIKDYLWLIQP